MWHGHSPAPRLGLHDPEIELGDRMTLLRSLPKPNHLYMTGHGFAAAAVWFQKAAEQGHAFAQSNLGVLCREGRGVAQDHTEEVVRIRRAADQGDPVGEFLLGNQYVDGKGAPQDYAEACDAAA